MFDVLYKIYHTLIEMRDLMVKMEEHLNDLTLPPDMRKWAKELKKKKEE